MFDKLKGVIIPGAGSLRVSSFIGAFLLGTISVVGFQNCSSEPALQSVSRAQQAIENGSFPYELSIDQLAYMSCSQQDGLSPDRSAFFTFRAGAYSGGGLRLTDAFLEETQRFPTSAQVDILNEHIQSAGSQIRFSVRSSSDLRAAFTNNGRGDQGREGFDYTDIFPRVGDFDLVSQLLAAPAKEIRTNIAAFDESEQNFEGDIIFSDSEANMEELRSLLNDGSAFLTLTLHDFDFEMPRGPGLNLLDEVPDDFSVARNAYGLGFRLGFSQPFAENFLSSVPLGQTTHINVPRRILTSVQEVNLGDEAQERRPWICPERLRYRIVRPEVAGASPGDPQYTALATCDMADDPLTLGPELTLARRSLRAEDWWIDQSKNCIVPKPGRSGEGICNGLQDNPPPGDPSIVVNHNFTENCGFGTDSNGLPLGACPHFVSICIRQ